MFEKLPKRVTVYEVGPRDGLQNEPDMVPTADKLRFIERLLDAGLSRVEITSFVSPKWIPQLADSRELAAAMGSHSGKRLSALVPNRRGFDNARDSGIREIAVFLSASETHNKKNVNKSVADTIDAFNEFLPEAKSEGMFVRAYISTVFGCPYEGEVDPDAVIKLCDKLISLGADEISLGDTIGVGNPLQVHEVLARVLANTPVEKIAVHFHDTQGTALANCVAALDQGISIIDSSVGGLGGCPYAPGASGNVATEDVVAMLHGMGIETGIDLDKLVDCAHFAGTLVGRDLPSKYLRAHLGKKQRAHRVSE